MPPGLPPADVPRAAPASSPAALAPIPGLALGIVAAAVPVHLWLALATDLSPDEAYYLCAARLSGGIPDHPPLTLWLLRAGDLLGGPVELRARLPALLLSAATSLTCIALARHRGAGPDALAITALVATWALLPMAGGFVMTPDGPALLAIALALLATGAELTPRRAVLAGLALLAGALAKVVALPIALLLAAFAGRDAPRPAPRAARLLLGLAPFLAFPLLVPSLAFQLRHAFAQGPPTGWSLLGAVGAVLGAASAQALLWSPPLVWLGLRALRTAPTGDRAVVVGLSALVVASALARAIPPEPNWWAPAALVVLVAGARAAAARPRARRAVLLTVLLPTVVATVHTVRPFLLIPERVDPTARLHGWSRGPEPTSAPGVGTYGPAAERCVYRNDCKEIISYFNAMRSKE